MPTATERFRLPWARAVGILLRTAHLGAMAVLVGGVHFGVPAPALRAWALLTTATGVALLAAEASHSRHWPYQGRGLAAILHVGAVALVASEAAGRAALVPALALGAAGSHLPGAIRKWSLRHRRVVE